MRYGEITLNLWFDADAEEAVNKYTDIFDDSSTGRISRYDEASAAVAGRPLGSTSTVDFKLAGHPFVPLNGGPGFDFTQAISFIVNCPTKAGVAELWEALSAGGETLMSVESYPFSERYGWIEDKYGVSWQIVPTILTRMQRDLVESWRRCSG